MPQDTDALDRRAKLGQLIGPWTNVPALVYDRHLNVVVSNELAGIVQPTFRVGSNLARAAFLNEELDRSLGDVPVKHARVAAELREALETQGEDAAYVSLVGELASLSDAFARSWADVSGEAPDGVFRFKHARSAPSTLPTTDSACPDRRETPCSSGEGQTPVDRRSRHPQACERD